MLQNKGERIMFKKILTCIAAVAIAVASGCTENKVDNGEVEIHVLARGGADKGVVQGLVDKFNKENEGRIRIKYEEKDDSINEYLRVALQAGNAPDIIEGLNGAVLDMAIDAGWLRPLDEKTIETYKEKLVNGAIRKQKNGNVYNVSQSSGGTFKLIWNKELFKECGLDPERAPQTWDEVIEYAKIITEKGNGIKYGFAIPFKIEGFARYYVMMPGSTSDLYNVDGYEPTTGKYDFSIYKPMLKVLTTMVEDGSVLPSPLTLDNDTARAQFAEGNVGMMFAARWDAGVFNNQFPCKYDWGIADFPTFDGEFIGSVPIAVASGQKYMTANSKHPEEQLEVYNYFHSEEFARTIQEAGVYISSYKSLAKPELMDSSIKGYVELNIPEEGKPLHYIDSVEQPDIVLEGDNYEKVMAAIVAGQISIDEGINDLNERYNKSIDEWIKKGNDINKLIIPDYNPNTYIPE